MSQVGSTFNQRNFTQWAAIMYHPVTMYTHYIIELHVSSSVSPLRLIFKTERITTSFVQGLRYPAQKASWLHNSCLLI